MYRNLMQEIVNVTDSFSKKLLSFYILYFKNNNYNALNKAETSF